MAKYLGLCELPGGAAGGGCDVRGRPSCFEFLHKGLTKRLLCHGLLSPCTGQLLVENEGIDNGNVQKVVKKKRRSILPLCFVEDCVTSN